MVAAENDVEYAELSAEAVRASVRGGSRLQEAAVDPLDEHMLLFHLLDMQERGGGGSRTWGTSTGGPQVPTSRSRPPTDHRIEVKNFVDILDDIQAAISPQLRSLPDALFALPTAAGAARAHQVVDADGLFAARPPSSELGPGRRSPCSLAGRKGQ